MKPIDIIKSLAARYPSKKFTSSDFARAALMLKQYNHDAVQSAINQLPSKQLEEPMGYLLKIVQTLISKGKYPVVERNQDNLDRLNNLLDKLKKGNNK